MTPRKEAAVAAANKRASAHLDEELGIEDDDYNANYDDEDVALERPTAGGGERAGAGDDVDEELLEGDGEAHLSRSRSNRRSSFRRSRSADIGTRVACGYTCMFKYIC